MSIFVKRRRKGEEMRVFHNRPLALACVLFALTLIATWSLGAILKLLLIGIVIFFLFLLLLKKIKSVIPFLCLIFVILALLVSLFFFNLRYANAQELVGKSIEVKAIVLERTQSTAYSSAFRVQVCEINGERQGFYATMETSYASALQVGDCFKASVTPREFRREGEYEEEFYRLSQGELLILVSENAEECLKTQEEISHLGVWFSTWNTKLSYQLYQEIEGEAGALSAALLLGNKSFLAKETSLHFRRAGISHLLALSGLHVSILIGMLEWLLRLLRIPKLLRAGSILLASLGYLCLTGFSPSITRAVIMACVLYLAIFAAARYDSFTAISTALFLILLISPYAIFDLSLWLSFFAALSIIVFSPAFSNALDQARRRIRLPRWVFVPLRKFLTAVFVGVIANIGIMLLSALAYGEFSILSVPATLILSLPISVLLPISAVTLFLPSFSELCSGLAELLLWGAELGSAMQGILIPIADPVTLTFIIVLTLVLVLFAVTSFKARYALCLLPILFVGSCACAVVVRELPAEKIEVQVFQSFGGEVLFFSQNQEAIAVDLANGVVTESQQIQDAAKEAHITEIGDLILTRYYGRLPYLIASLSERISLRRVRLPFPQSEQEKAIAARVEEEATLHGIEARYDCDSLAIEAIDLIAWEHTPMQADAAAQILLSFQIKDHIFTCINAAILEGELNSLARNYTVAADTLLITARAKGQDAIPTSPNLKNLILGNQGFRDRVWNLPSDAEISDLPEPCQFSIK